jgi:hypothetical protein
METATGGDTKERMRVDQGIPEGGITEGDSQEGK